jgi:hypothetical protein
MPKMKTIAAVTAATEIMAAPAPAPIKKVDSIIALMKRTKVRPSPNSLRRPAGCRTPLGRRRPGCGRRGTRSIAASVTTSPPTIWTRKMAIRIEDQLVALVALPDKMIGDERRRVYGTARVGGELISPCF